MSGQSSQAAVDAHDVSFSYGQRQALAEVTFRVPSGQIFGFLGPNGGGKTTLFRILATLVPPQKGSLQVFGWDLAAQADRVRFDLGVVFQTPSLDRLLTVEENLVHQGHLHRLAGAELRARARELLRQFKLEDRAGERVSTLSGGMMRRVEIAKALLHRPRLLILDEPSSGLDPGARRDLWRVLEDLRTSLEVTVLLTTHFIEEGDRCDRLILLDQGRVVAEGEPRALKQEIGGDVVMVSTGDPVGLGQDLRDDYGLEVTLHGDVLRFEHPQAQELVATMGDSLRARIEALTISKPTLEDVFLRRTGHGLWEGEE